MKYTPKIHNRILSRKYFLVIDNKLLTIKDYYYRNFLSFSKKHFISLVTLERNINEMYMNKIFHKPLTIKYALINISYAYVNMNTK